MINRIRNNVSQFDFIPSHIRKTFVDKTFRKHNYKDRFVNKYKL